MELNSRKGKRCCIYIRVSSERQVEGFSLDGQKRYLSEWAAFEGMEVAGIYAEEGKSGKSIDGRDEFQKMLSDIASGMIRVDFVVVFKLSRFGRNAKDILNSLSYIQSYGVNLICKEDGLDSSTNMGRMMITILGAVAEMERENILAQTYLGREEKARQGGWNGGFAPYGYRLNKENGAGNGFLEIDEETAPTVKMIFEKFVNENMGYSTIAGYLNKQGVPKLPNKNSHGREFTDWDTMQIKRILKNPLYAGKIAFGRTRTQKVAGTENEYRRVLADSYILSDRETHTPIVSQELFDMAQKKIGEPKVKGNPHIGRTNKHLLSGLLRCPMCGSSMYADVRKWTNKDGSEHMVVNYQCGHYAKAKHGQCKKNAIRAEWIESEVIAYTKLLVQNPQFAADIQSRITSKMDYSGIECEIRNYREHLEGLERSKSNLEKDIDSVTGKYAERKREDLNRRLDKVYEEIYETEDRISDCEFRMESAKKEAFTQDNIYQILLAFDKFIDIMDPEDKRKMMECLISEIRLYPKETWKEGQSPIKYIKYTFPVTNEVRQNLREKVSTVDAKELLKLVGGKENIAAVSHCMTRMRFVLNDPKKADIPKIEAMKVVKGSFTQTGQFQVIIGNTVADFYNDFIAVSGIEGVSKDAVKSAAKQNQNVLQRMITALAEIFAPLIPAIITGGLILGFRNCIDSLYLFENGTKTLCDISQFWTGIDSFLWLIGEAVFHMLPVGICWSVTKKMGTTQMLGIVLGLTLVSGQLLNAYAVANTVAADIPVWDFGYFKVNMIGYQAQVIPAILAAFTLVYLEKFFRRITPQVISMIVVPFCSLLLAVMASHFVLGPIGWKIGSAISAVVYAGITGSFKVIFGAIFGFVYAPLVITGLHHMSNAIDLQLIADYGGTMLWPMIALSNIAQGSAVFGMIALQRKDPEAQEVNVPACISCYLGVTEPAIFGVNLKHVFPFVCGMIGSACAAVVCVAMGTTANAIGVGGLPGILSIRPDSMPGFAICMVIAVVVPFVLTMIVGKKKLASGQKSNVPATELAEIASGDGAGAAADVAASVEQTKEQCKKELKAFLSGKVIPLKEVGDGVFSEGVMGDGLAIVPESDTLTAPVDATVSVLMQDSKHACGLTLDNGMELLLHVGIDTVDMQGDGFVYLISEGQRVTAGTPLIRFNREKIKQAGHPDTTVCIVTEPGGAENIRFFTGMDGKANETIVAAFE